MKQNILNNIQNNNIQNNNISDNNISDNNTYFCAKCLRKLNSNDRNIVKDVDDNIFCDRECRSYFRKENHDLIDEIIGGF